MEKRIGITILLILLLTGCGKQKLSEEYKTVVDNYAQIVLPQDQDSYEYDQALELVGTYLKESTPENLEKAQSVIEDTSKRFQKILDEEEDREPDENLKEDLKTCGVLVEDYKISFELRDAWLQSYADSLSVLAYYLNLENSKTPFRKELVHIYNSDIKFQEYCRFDLFYTINYLFIDWKEKPVAYLYEKIIDNMKSLNANEVHWETDKKVIENKTEASAKQMEDELSRMSSYIGEMQEQLYQMESELLSK